MDAVQPGRDFGSLPFTVTTSDKTVILVAEDNEADVLAISRAFRDTGGDYVLHTVSDGEQTIAYLKGEGEYSDRAKYRIPDLLLLDLKMPRKDGFGVLAWLQKQPTLACLRTVVLTTSDQIRDVNRAYALGASSFLVKPLHFAEFKETIFAMQKYWLNLNRKPQISRPETPTPQPTLFDPRTLSEGRAPSSP
jgi:CheY-like chemotaxis protein